MIRVILPWIKSRFLNIRMRRQSFPPGARLNLAARVDHGVFQPVRRCRYVAFDLETTGFDCARDRIVGIGAVRVENGRIRLGQSFSQIVNPKIKMAPASVKVHRIMPQAINKAPSASEAVDSFLQFLGKDILVAHRAGFDVGFLNRYMKEQYKFPLQNIVLDTMPLSQSLLLPELNKNPVLSIKVLGTGRGVGTPRRYSLDEIAQLLGIEIHQRHTGIGDALATAMLFQRILAKAEEKQKGRLIQLIALGGL